MSGCGGRAIPKEGIPLKPSVPSMASGDRVDKDGAFSGVLKGLSPKFQSPRTPSKPLSVEPNPSTEYCPVSCCRCANNEAGGGPELRAGVVVDLLYNDSDNKVSGLILRAYSAVRTDGGGRAKVACNRIGFLPSSVKNFVLSFPPYVIGIGSLTSLYPLVRYLNGILGASEGICPKGMLV